MTLAEQVRNRRKALGLTLREVEKRSGVPYTHISSFEHGHQSNPTLQTLAGLAEAFGCRPEDLIDSPALVDARSLSIPAVLLQLGSDNGLSHAELEMLAGLSWRGQQPQSYADWWFLWQALVRACALRVDTETRED